MRNMSIRNKLLTGFSIVLALLVMIIALGLYQIITMDRTYTRIMDDRMQKMLDIKDMVIAVKTQQVGIRGFAQLGDETALNAIETTHAQFAQISQRLKEQSTTPTMLDLLDKATTVELEYHSLGLEIVELKRSNNTQALTAALTAQDRAKIAELEAAMTAMSNYQKQQLDTGINEAATKIENLQLLILILGAAAVVLGIATALTMGSFISKPLSLLARASEKIAIGDLTGEKVTMTSNDEIGKLASSFNMMSNNLKAMIMQVTDGATQVASAAEELTANAEQATTVTEQIASTMQELASGSDTQVQLVNDGLQTTNEMSTGFQQIAVNTQNVSTKAVEASEKAIAGNESISTVIGQMNAIQQKVQSLSSVVHELGDQSQEIGHIVQAITDISSQTNLLALNASIEAARAGEHGRGFQVVASEVRKLSQQSAESAEQISSLISTITNGMGKAVQSMNDVTEEVKAGISTVHVAGQSFEHIRESVNEVAVESEEVSAAVQQMTAGVEQMAHAMKVISGVTESSAAGTEQVTASTEEQLSSMEEVSAAATTLSQIADRMQTTVSRFTI